MALFSKSFSPKLKLPLVVLSLVVLLPPLLFFPKARHRGLSESGKAIETQLESIESTSLAGLRGRQDFLEGLLEKAFLLESPPLPPQEYLQLFELAEGEERRFLIEILPVYFKSVEVELGYLAPIVETLSLEDFFVLLDELNWWETDLESSSYLGIEWILWELISKGLLGEELETFLSSLLGDGKGSSQGETIFDLGECFKSAHHERFCLQLALHPKLDFDWGTLEFMGRRLADRRTPDQVLDFYMKFYTEYGLLELSDYAPAWFKSPKARSHFVDYIFEFYRSCPDDQNEGHRAVIENLWQNLSPLETQILVFRQAVTPVPWLYSFLLSHRSDSEKLIPSLVFDDIQGEMQRLQSDGRLCDFT